MDQEKIGVSGIPPKGYVLGPGGTPPSEVPTTWMNWMVSALLPTPPPPTTTSLCVSLGGGSPGPGPPPRGRPRPVADAAPLLMSPSLPPPPLQPGGNRAGPRGRGMLISLLHNHELRRK